MPSFQAIVDREPRHPFRNRLLLSGLLLVTAAFFGVVAAPGHAQVARDGDRRCLNCHGNKDILKAPDEELKTMVGPLPAGADLTRPLGQRPGLFIPADAFTGGVHANLSCVECHTDAGELPHAQRLERQACAESCHPQETVRYRRGVHAEAKANKVEDAPGCVDCHGGHGILPPSNRDSTTYPLNVINTCATCHEQHHEKASNGQDEGEWVHSYMESVHGRAVSGSGLVVAATCVSCHNAHEILHSDNPNAATSREKLSATCGECHRGVAEIFDRSIHGQLLAEGDENAPVCSDCHTAHSITRAGTSNFTLDIVNECGQCHNQPSETGRSLYETYRLSYHGQVTALGSERAARCADCHGAHDILPPEDPLSRIHEDQLIATCGECHPGSNANFVAFMPHADHRDKENYFVLNCVWLYFIIVMSGTFSFFGMHMILWFVRGAINRIRHGKHDHHSSSRYAIQRFNKLDRVNHALLIVSFFGLTLTGMPLFFSDQHWARALAWGLGGVHGAGLLHRIFAVMLLVNGVLHFYGLAQRLRAHGFKKILLGPNSMMFKWRDVKDCFGMFRWFLTGKKQPRFDRWTYWEKFDYWAEIFGTSVIGFTGLMLWFPMFFAEFMPGWLFNIAMIIHGYEALLAVGFIFTIHFFNGHLRVDKFPVDDVMFTGRLPEDEFKHERPDEYDRLVASGELEKLRVPRRTKLQRRLSVIGGIIAMVVGTTMVVLIILGGLQAI